MFISFGNRPKSSIPPAPIRDEPVPAPHRPSRPRGRLNRARGLLTAGPFRIRCALGPAGVVRTKREGDRRHAGRALPLLWGYYRPDRARPPAGGVPLKSLRRDQGWCEDPTSGRYNRPVRLPAADCTDRMWRDDHLYDLTFVLDQNFSRRAKGRGSAIFFHLARPGLTPTAGCVAISAADMRKLAPRLARGARWRSAKRRPLPLSSGGGRSATTPGRLLLPTPRRASTVGL